jgi:hypothetical protein
MEADRGPKSSRNKVREYRKRQRQQGMRPIQIWGPTSNQRLSGPKRIVSRWP